MPRNWYEYVKNAQVREQEHWLDIGHYGVSKIGECTQKIWFEIMNKYTESYRPRIDFKKIFFIGTAIHELIQNFALERGAIKERKIEYTPKDGTFSVMSYIDLIDPEIGIIDIKTTWAKPENYDPSNAIRQVNFYMGAIGIHTGGVLVISLNNIFESFQIKDIFFIPHQFSTDMFEEDCDKLSKLTIALREKKPVEIYDESHCKYCEYENLCPKRAVHDKIYEAQWKIFKEEIEGYEKRKREQEQKTRDATSDGYCPTTVDAPLEGIEIDLSAFKNF